MRSLFLHELRLRLPAMSGWSVGLASFTTVYLALYPELERQLGASALAAKFFSIYRVVGVDVGSFEAYFASSIVQFVIVLFGIYAIVNGTDTLVGEEDRGSLELLVAMPLPRWKIVTAKAMAMLSAAVIVLALTGVAGMALFDRMKIKTTVTAIDIFAAIIAGLPLILAFMMVSLFLGSCLPTRRVAAMTATVLYVASYFGERLANMAKSLRPVSRSSLFHYFDTTSALLTEGLHARDVAILLATAVFFFVLSLICFARRDLMTRSWPWRRNL